MTLRRSLLILVPAVLLLAAGTFQLHRLVARQADEAEALAARAASLEKEIAALQRAHETTQRDYEAASRQLAELPPPADAAARARELDVQAWLGRVKRLRQLFVDRPDQAIPELRLLDDNDWLRVARKLDLGTDEKVRQGLAAIRAAAVTKFTREISKAVSKYMRTPPAAKPETALALAPYFDSPPDLAMLQRFEITTVLRPGAVALDRPNTPGWMIWEAAPIDADYDTRHGVQSTGGSMGMSAPAAWIPDYRERSAAAHRQYAAANGGIAPANFAAVAPFFQPPLDPAVVEKLVKAERDRVK